MERTTSTKICESREVGGSSKFCLNESIYSSRAGAHLSLRLSRTSRRWVTADSNGDEVGEIGDESVTRTGC